MKTYNNNTKRNIQSYFYNKSKVRGNVVCLVGSSFDKHINDIKTILNTKGIAKAYCYDNDKDVINRFKHLETNNIKLIYNNIAAARIERFMDIDLMSTLITTGNVIEYLFKEQVYKYKNVQLRKYHKTFMFTASRRKTGTKMIHDFTNSLINKLNIDWTMLDVEIKHYHDTSVMSTVQINWK